MLKEPLGSCGRRNFMQSLLITALVLTGIGMAQAQDSAPGTPAEISTVYAGDGISGKKVVSSLNTSDLERGKKHLLYFQGVQMSTGQHWYVSVIVAKRDKPGKRITLTSGMHGDEMSSVHTVQTIMGQLTVCLRQRCKILRTLLLVGGWCWRAWQRGGVAWAALEPGRERWQGLRAGGRLGRKQHGRRGRSAAATGEQSNGAR
jgi:hypothetical protein